MPVYPVATTLNGGITNVALSLTVNSATGFPAVPFVVTIGTEQINVTATAGVVWTITRGANGTTAAAHSNGDVVSVVVPIDNASLGPPPVATSILNQTPDEFGVPYLQRGKVSGNVASSWTSWFRGVWNKLITAVFGLQAATILNGAITNVAVALVVDSATGFPAVPFVVLIDSEQINVTVKAGVNWTITRAANGTAATAHADNAPVTLKPIVTPGRLVKVEADGVVDESAIATTDVVLGAANLTNVGAIPKVASAGTLTESAMTDDGATNIYTTARGLIAGAAAAISTAAGRLYIAVKGSTGAGVFEAAGGAADADAVAAGIFQVSDSHGTNAELRLALIQVLTDGTTANKRGGRLKIATKADNGAIAFWITLDQTGKCGFGGNAAPAYAMDATGDVNVSGVFRVGTVAGLSATITTAKLTLAGANGSMTFTGGILTAQTPAT